MIREKRWEKILSLLEKKDSLQVSEISSSLNVSEATIRRDIIELDQQGQLVKVHGGVLKSNNSYVVRDLTMSEKHDLNLQEKQKIGAYAATLIEPNDFVYIDSGTTTEALAMHITQKDATYVTNSLTVAHILIQKGLHTILPGGEIKVSTEALVGSETVDAISRYNFTIGFFGTNGANEENGFTTPEVNEARVKQIAMEHTKRKYVLCDHSKFSVISPISFGKFEEATIITDHYPKKKKKNIVEVK